MTYPAPIQGWVKNDRILNASVSAAEVLDNVFPTAQGARMRSGREKHATVTGSVRRLLEYRSGATEKLFAATETAVYDVTSPADPAVSPSADISSLSGGEWVGVQFANTSGQYLWMVNGTDAPQHYDGSTWATPTITGSGLTNADLSQAWTYRSRIYAIEGGTMNVWYLGVNSISGTATKFAVQGVFNNGGSLLFGATWSLDAGDGLDDVCVLVTTEGEAAIYAGSDPSAWSLQGVYRVGRPLDKAGFYRVGGDLMILTEDGITPLSAAIKKTPDQLQTASAAYAIEDAWRESIAGRSASFNFSVALWHSRSMLVIGAPILSDGSPVAYVANSRTGAWCRYVNWSVDCAAVVNDRLYFGTEGASESIIYKAEATGSDDGTAIAARWVPKFQDPDGLFKAAMHARTRARAQEAYNIGMGAAADYVVANYPSPSVTTSESPNAWGSGVWGTMVWGGTSANIKQDGWRAVSAAGTSLAPIVAATSNRTTENSLEFVAVDLLYESGSVL